MQVTGVPEFRAALSLIREAERRETRGAVHDGGEAAVRSMRTFASGRPGPIPRSGALLGGIHHTPTGEFSEKVSTGTVYSRRVELGFVGFDRAGRYYGPPRNPAMYPYFFPGWTAAMPQMEGVFYRHWAAPLI